MGSGKGRWEEIREKAKRPTIGKIIDEALVEIETENPRLKNLLDKRFARTQLEPGKLGELIDEVSKIGLIGNGHKDDTEGSIKGSFHPDFRAHALMADHVFLEVSSRWRAEERK